LSVAVVEREEELIKNVRRFFSHKVDRFHYK
jgi:hypothetical protein